MLTALVPLRTYLFTASSVYNVRNRWPCLSKGPIANLVRSEAVSAHLLNHRPPVNVFHHSAGHTSQSDTPKTTKNRKNYTLIS